jgi:hypothetical protein
VSARPPQPVTFSARDARALAGLSSEAAEARGALVVNGATGFPREFYLWRGALDWIDARCS